LLTNLVPRATKSKILVAPFFESYDPDMQNRHAILLFIMIFILGFAALPAAAQHTPDGVRSLLEKRDAEIKALLGDKETFTDAQREALKKVINDGIDFAAMGRHALGPFWKDLSADQKNEFVEVFSDIVRSQSLSNLEAYRAKVAYQSVDVKGDSAYVLTTTLYKKVEMNVAYELGFHDGRWWVTDIVLDEVSTADGYARSFQAVIRKKGFDVLMQRLRDRRDRPAKAP